MLGGGWAHYRGPAGEAAFHAHYPVQLVFSVDAKAAVVFEKRNEYGHFIIVPSNMSHMLKPSPRIIDLLFIEPTLLLQGEENNHKELPEWLNLLRGKAAQTLDPRLEKALAAVDRLLESKVLLHEIAQSAGMSKSSFTQLFREHIGMPLRRYVLWRRLNVAVATIHNGLDVTTAAHKAGFADSAHFSRTMKETFGVSPSQSLLQIQMTIDDSFKLHLSG